MRTLGRGEAFFVSYLARRDRERVCGVWVTVEEFYSDVAGSPFDPEADEFAVIAKKP